MTAMQITIQPSRAEYQVLVEPITVSRFRVTVIKGQESTVFLGDQETCSRAVDHLMACQPPFPPPGNYLGPIREAITRARSQNVAEWLSQEDA